MVEERAPAAAGKEEEVAVVKVVAKVERGTEAKEAVKQAWVACLEMAALKERDERGAAVH